MTIVFLYILTHLNTTVVTNLEYRASNPALLVTWHSTISLLKGPNLASKSLLYSMVRVKLKCGDLLKV